MHHVEPVAKKKFTLKFQFHDKKLKVENEQKQRCIANSKTLVITPDHTINFKIFTLAIASSSK